MAKRSTNSTKNFPSSPQSPFGFEGNIGNLYWNITFFSLQSITSIDVSFLGIKGIPYTLYPIPYTHTLYPIPLHALHPIPNTLYPTPYTLYPAQPEGLDVGFGLFFRVLF